MGPCAAPAGKVGQVTVHFKAGSGFPTGTSIITTYVRDRRREPIAISEEKHIQRHRRGGAPRNAPGDKARTGYEEE